MKGTILDYSVENGIGSISGDDGKSYEFSSTDWIDNRLQPEKNIKVDFDIQETTAINILSIEEQTMEEKTSKETTNTEAITEEKKPEEKKPSAKKIRVQWGDVFAKLGIIANNVLLLLIVLFLWKTYRDRQIENIEQAQIFINSVKVEQLSDNMTQIQQAKIQGEEALTLVNKVPNYPTLPYTEAQETKQQIEERLNKIKEKEKLLSENEKKAQAAFSLAIKAATEAIQVSKNPPHTQVIWEQAKKKWQEAITQLESVPSSSTIAKEVQEKIYNYQNRLDLVNQKIEDEKTAKLSYNSAIKNASNAFNLTKNNPSNISVWIQSSQEWQNALTNLKKIPSGTTLYPEGIIKLAEYEKNLTVVNQRIKQLELAISQP
jgi:hypothetical protein